MDTNDRAGKVSPKLITDPCRIIPKASKGWGGGGGREKPRQRFMKSLVSEVKTGTMERNRETSDSGKGSWKSLGGKRSWKKLGGKRVKK